MIPESIRIAYCYAPDDELLQNKLEKHLSTLKRLYHITNWSRNKIFAGQDRKKETIRNLDLANVILLLVSADFINSDYCYSVEMNKTLERHEAGKSHVLPIILRPTDWEKLPFGKLSVLPNGGKPITLWDNQDEALQNVAIAVRIIIETLFATRVEQEIQKVYLARCEQTLYEDRKPIIGGTDPETTNAHWQLSYALEEFEEKRVEEILLDCNQAIRDDPENPLFYQLKGDLYLHRKSYEKAFDSFNQAISIKPAHAINYIGKGRSLLGMKEYTKALNEFERAIQLDPSHVIGYLEKGCVLIILTHYEKALEVYKQALHYVSKEVEPLAYQALSDILRRLGHYNEAAIIAYNLTTQLLPSNIQVWLDKAEILMNLKRYDEAVMTYQQALEHIHFDSGRAILYWEMGEILKLLKRYHEALTAYDYAFRHELDPAKKIDIHGERGALLTLLKRPDEAIDAYLDQIEVCERICRSGRGSYEQIVQLTPTTVSSWKKKAMAFKQLHLYDEAIMAYQQTLKLINNISEKADIYLSIGSLLEITQALRRSSENILPRGPSLSQ